MRICVDCEQECVTEGWVFVCRCGVSFCLQVLTYHGTHVTVKPEVGLPLEGTDPFPVLTEPLRLVA